MRQISIIIPVFNAEKYLKKCLDSVLTSMKGYEGEILVIDNDSSDDSLVVLKEYGKEYPDIISVLQCHTPGAAAVRNFGARKAKGEYIWFIDADDVIDKTAVSKLLKEAEKAEADIVMMGAKRTNTKGETSYLSAVSTKDPDYKSRFIRYGMGPWQVIIRRKWWNEHRFAFKEGFIHEDMEMMSALILYTDKFASIDEPLYFYNTTPESVLHRKEFSPHIFDIFPALEGLYQRFKEADAEKKYHGELEWFFIWNLLIDSAKDFRQFPEGRPGFKRSREMLKEYFPNWRKNRFLREKPLKLQMKIKINYIK